jgi:hypothetical protein
MGMIGNSLAQGLISGANIQDGTVDTPDIKDSAVTTAKITDANVTTAKIADGAITTAKIANGAVATVDIADGAVTTAKITDANVTTAKVADGAITSAKIADATIATGDIADGAVTSAKIADGTIATGDIADSAITTAKIASSAVTSAKLASGAAVANIGFTPQQRLYFSARVRHNTWSRVFRLNISALYGAAIVNISHTRDSVVVGSTMVVSCGHSGGARIAQIEGHYYSTVKVGFENLDGNNAYFCINDNAYKASYYGTPADFDFEVSVIPIMGSISETNSGSYTAITSSIFSELQLGNSYYTSNGVSDRRYKSNIQPIENALEKVMQLNGCTFDMNGERDTGLIAQDALLVMPELVTGLPPKSMPAQERQQYMDSESYILGLKYANSAGLLVEAIKELNAKVEAQAAEIAALKGQE